MARPTRRGWYLLLVVAATYVAARLLGTWELYLLAFAFLAVLPASWLLVVLTARRLTVTRTFRPQQPTVGNTLTLSFRARNGSPLPGLQVTLQNATGDLAGPDRTIEFESLGSRAERRLPSGPWAVRRGVHQLPALIADVGDPLGLMHARLIVGDPAVLTVYPRLVFLGSCAPLVDDGRRGSMGRRNMPTLGGSEFRAIRQHQPGEPLSRVDWKSTARTGNLMLREMDDPESTDLVVLLDGSAPYVAGELPETNFELAVQAAGSVAAFALRAGRGVTMLLHEREWRRVRLASDAEGHQRLLDSLARVEPSARARLGLSLRPLLAGREGSLRAQTLALVVLGIDRELVRALVALRRDGVRVSVINVDPASFGAPAGGPEAQGLQLALAAAGVPCLTIGRGDDLRTALSLRQLDDRHALVP